MENPFKADPANELLTADNVQILERDLLRQGFVEDMFALTARMLHPSTRLAEIIRYMAYLVEPYDSDLGWDEGYPYSQAYIAGIQLGVGLVKTLRPDIHRRDLEQVLDDTEYRYDDSMAEDSPEIRYQKGKAVLERGFRVISANSQLDRLAEAAEDQILANWRLLLPFKSGLGSGFDMARRAVEKKDIDAMTQAADDLAKGVDFDREFQRLITRIPPQAEE